jgi:hypothetical protein
MTITKLSIIFLFLISSCLSLTGQRNAEVTLKSGAVQTLKVTVQTPTEVKFLKDNGTIGSIDKSAVESVRYLETSSLLDDTIAPDGTIETYCLILGTKVLLKNKVTVQIDFGQGINNWRPKQSLLTDANGKKVQFNSMIDALNFMASKGWSFVDAYAITVGNQHVYHWLMKKRVLPN